MNKNYPILNYIPWIFWSLLSYSGIMLICYYKPYIPEYDGLSYFEYSKIINRWLFESGDLKFSVNRLFDTAWPMTNAPSVIWAAIAHHTVGPNLAPTLINSIYLAVFIIYISKTRSSYYAYFALTIICANSYFYRLFTTLTSELPVGLWIFSYIIALLNKNKAREIIISTLIILGILLRTIDIVFIISSTTTYCFIHYILYKDKEHLKTTLITFTLTILLTLPLFLHHYRAAYNYVLESQVGVSSASWKMMAGVTSNFDVIYKYFEYLQIYNKIFISLTLFIVITSIIFNKTEIKNVLLITGTALGVVLPLLAASTLNIQTTFWIFSSISLISCEVLFNLIKNTKHKFIYNLKDSLIIRSIFTILLSVYCAYFINLSWKIENAQLKQLKIYYEISSKISSQINSFEGDKYITSNFRGVGPLDYNGLSWNSKNSLIEGGVHDIYSKNKPANYYLDFDKKVSFFISAHDNYFFPNHFGINDKISELNNLFNQKSSSLGFKKISEISYQNKFFDIWYKPTTQVHLQYASFNDTWISKNLSFDIGDLNLCKENTVSGTLKIDMIFHNPNLAQFKPPFKINFHKKNSKEVISSITIEDYGVKDINFNLINIKCGNYEISIDKSFSTAGDSRELSAQFVKMESELKFNF